MAEYLIQGETLTGIADAIRGKTGGTDPVAVSDMAARIEGIQAGGGDDVLNALIDRSITEISSEVIIPGSYALYGCKKLETADFPKAKEVGPYMFQECTSLKRVYFPVATYIRSTAFHRSGITEINFPNATTFDTNSFQSCSNLTAINKSNVPLVSQFSSGVFSYCEKLAEVNFPSLTYAGASSFSYCTSLVKADFSALKTCSSSVFQSCSSLISLIIRKTDGVCALGSTNAFNNTPIKSGTGYIYVPSALIEQYKVATNWSTYVAQFRALEDYTVDGTVTGELDPAKTGT